MEHLMHTDAAHTFFHENPGPRNMQQNPEKSVKFVECIKKLTSYAVMLMKPERLRPDMWDVSFTPRNRRFYILYFVFTSTVYCRTMWYI